MTIDMKDVPPDAIANGATHRRWDGKWVNWGLEARHALTGEILVVYKSIWPDPIHYLVAPKTFWDEQVEIEGKMVPRFEKITMYWNEHENPNSPHFKGTR